MVPINYVTNIKRKFMNKYLIITALLASFTTSVFAQATTVGTANALANEKKFSIEVGTVSSWLIEEKMDQVYKTDDFFDDQATGFDVNLGYQATDKLRVSVGYNQVEFDSERLSIPLGVLGTAFLDANGLDIDATYIGAEFTFAKSKKVSFFGVAQVGQSNIDSVTMKYSFSLFPEIHGQDKYYKDSSNLYYALGTGLKVDLNENFYLKASYMYRDYGKSEATAYAKSFNIKSFDVATNTVNVSVGFNF